MSVPNQNSAGILQVYPYLRARNASAAIDFYKRIFGAVEKSRLTEPKTDRVGHAQLDFAGTTVMISDEYPEFGIFGPEKYGGTGSLLHLHVSGVDALHSRAIEAGATELMPPTDMFYGERASKLRDPFGHEWMLGQHIEDVSPEEMQARYNAMCQ